MKIVCMDCQTESYMDVDLLKDKKHIECNHCADSLPATSPDEAAEQASFPAADASVFCSDISHQAPAESSFPNSGADDILEISDIPPIQETSDLLELDAVISFPLDEPVAEFPEASQVSQLNETPEPLKMMPQELPEQVTPQLIPATKPSETVEESSTSAQSFEAVPPVGKGGFGSGKVLTIGTPVLLILVVAFVVFITLGNIITAPTGEVRADSATPARTVSLPDKEIKQPAVSVPAKPAEAVKPTPAATPIVTESKPPVETPSTNPATVPASAPEKGQFTVQVGSHNEPGAANDQAEKLKAAGFEPRVVSVDIPKRGRWYRVQTGSFNSREEANQHGAQILAKGAAETFVISGL